LRWGWRVAFVIRVCWGFVAHRLRRFYYLPQEHPRISDAERQMILAEKPRAESAGEALPRWRDLLKLPQTSQ